MSSEAPGTTELVMPSLTEPAIDTRTAVAVGDAEGDWLCAWCLNRVANERDKFKYDGKDHFVFANPEGLRFHIMTFFPLKGCRQAGEPTLEFTWFPGHAWSFCQCERCGQHLGWYYTGEHHFAGLISDHLVRGQCVRN